MINTSLIVSVCLFMVVIFIFASNFKEFVGLFKDLFHKDLR